MALPPSASILNSAAASPPAFAASAAAPQASHAALQVAAYGSSVPSAHAPPAATQSTPLPHLSEAPSGGAPLTNAPSAGGKGGAAQPPGKPQRKPGKKIKTALIFGVCEAYADVRPFERAFATGSSRMADLPRELRCSVMAISAPPPSASISDKVAALSLTLAAHSTVLQAPYAAPQIATPCVSAPTNQAPLSRESRLSAATSAPARSAPAPLAPAPSAPVLSAPAPLAPAPSAPAT